MSLFYILAKSFYRFKLQLSLASSNPWCNKQFVVILLFTDYLILVKHICSPTYVNMSVFNSQYVLNFDSYVVGKSEHMYLFLVQHIMNVADFLPK